MKKFFVLFFAAALLTTSACGGKKKAGDNDDGDNGGPGGKPTTVTITVTNEAGVEVTDSEITFKAHDSKTVEKDGASCTINGIESDVTVEYEVKGKKLTLKAGGETDTVNKISGAENSIWGEWSLGEKTEESGTISGSMTFQKDKPNILVLKATCKLKKK